VKGGKEKLLCLGRRKGLYITWGGKGRAELLREKTALFIRKEKGGRLPKKENVS